MLKKTLPLLFCPIVLAFCASCASLPPSPTAQPIPTSPVYPIEANSTATYPLSPQTSSTPQPGLPVFQISMFPEGTGWGMNTEQESLYHTSDGATTWADVSPSADTLSQAMGSVFTFFLDGQTGWLSVPQAETSTLYHTTDGGFTWTSTPLDFPGGSLYFLDTQNGFLLSRLGVAAGSEYVALYFTGDAGQTWQQRFSHVPGEDPASLPAGGNKNGFVFLNQNIGWVTGSEPVTNFIYLYRTTNGGEFWEGASCALPDDAGENMFVTYPPIFVDQDHGFLPVRGVGAKFMTHLCVSSDAGATWTYASTFTDTNQHDFVDRSNGWALGLYGLFRTTDGAQTWQDLSAALPVGFTALDMDFVDAQHGWLLVTTLGAEHLDENFLYKTSDGGQTWTLIPATFSK
ncbi:MAG: hypothetical protein WA110_01885 [Anaerolineaceae bacterium]